MKELINILYVALGGAIGSSLRYLSGITLNKYFASTIVNYTFLTTLFVNLLGSFFIGFVGAQAGVKFQINNYAKLFIFTGLFGGFTTFSSFSLDNLKLIQDGAITLGITNVIIQPILGLILVSIGWKIGSII